MIKRARGVQREGGKPVFRGGGGGGWGYSTKFHPGRLRPEVQTRIPYPFSIALALKKANFVSRNMGQFNKSAFLPLCQPCIRNRFHLLPYPFIYHFRKKRHRFHISSIENGTPYTYLSSRNTATFLYTLGVNL